MCKKKKKKNAPFLLRIEWPFIVNVYVQQNYENY